MATHTHARELEPLGQLGDSDAWVLSQKHEQAAPSAHDATGYPTRVAAPSAGTRAVGRLASCGWSG